MTPTLRYLRTAPNGILDVLIKFGSNSENHTMFLFVFTFPSQLCFDISPVGKAERVIGRWPGWRCTTTRSTRSTRTPSTDSPNGQGWQFSKQLPTALLVDWTWPGTHWTRCPARLCSSLRTWTSLTYPSTKSSTSRRTLLLVLIPKCFILNLWFIIVDKICTQF